MSGEVIVCGRCGSQNAAGDQFCGTCGAFLEWEGEPLEAGGAVGTGHPPASPPPGSQPAPPPTAATPPVTPSISPAPARPAPPAPGPGDVVCPACGRANPPGRTFCQSCGNQLRREVAAPAPEAGLAAPAAPRPREKEPTGPSGGLPGWLPVVIGLGIVAGIAVVAASVLLRPPDPRSAASAAPGTSPPTLTPTLPPASPGESGSGASPSPPPLESVALTMTGAGASSVVGNRELFAPSMVIDGQLTTSWQEGATDEAGEWIEVTFEAGRLDYVVVYGGYQLSHDAWLANLRPKDVAVSVNGGAPQGFLLADTEQPQRIDVEDLPGATTVRITIVSTYPSEASAYPGSPFDDMAISEIRAFGVPGG